MEESIEPSSIYLISDARTELIDLWVEGNSEPFNYIELSIDYSYVDDAGESMTFPLPPLCLDLDALIEMSALISRAMVRLEDANPVDIMGWSQDLEFDEDDGWDPNAGNPLD